MNRRIKLKYIIKIIMQLKISLNILEENKKLINKIKRNAFLFIFNSSR